MLAVSDENAAIAFYRAAFGAALLWHLDGAHVREVREHVHELVPVGLEDDGAFERDVRVGAEFHARNILDNLL